MLAIGRRGLIAGLIIIRGGAALAQPPGPGQRGQGMGQGPGLGRMNDPAGYMESLKSQLGITSDQAPAWKEYADTAIGMSTQMQGVRQSMWESMQTATWQERRDMMNTMFEARQMGFNSVHEAAQKLLVVLTPGQRQKAAGMLPGLATPGPMGPGQGRGGGPGMGPGYMRNQQPPG